MLSPARHPRACTPANRRGVERKLDESVRSPHLVALRDTGSVHVRRPVYGLASRSCARCARPRIGAFPCNAQWRMPTLELLAYRCEGSVGIGSRERETHRLPVSSRSTDVLRDTSKRCGRLQCPRGESTGAARCGQALTIARRSKSMHFEAGRHSKNAWSDTRRETIIWAALSGPVMRATHPA